MPVGPTMLIYYVNVYALYMTKMVQLSDDAYRRLRSRKKEGESFSDVVVRLAGDGDLASLAGLRTSDEIQKHAAWLGIAKQHKEPDQEEGDHGRA